MKANDLDSYRESLLEEKKRLNAALEYLQTENPGVDEEGVPELSTLEAHLAEAGTVTFDREIDYSLEEVTLEHLNAIEQALGRIESGKFGLCTSCGRRIASDRLQALPWASLCIDCKRREERG